jgi:hypothetical protein
LHCPLGRWVKKFWFFRALAQQLFGAKARFLIVKFTPDLKVGAIENGMKSLLYDIAFGTMSIINVPSLNVKRHYAFLPISS